MDGTDRDAREPYRWYAQLRKAPPVLVPGRPAVWAVSRYADVAAVLRDPGTFSSSVMAAADPTLLGADPPRHARARRIVQHLFSPARLATLEQPMRVCCESLIDRMVDDGQHDLVEDLATPLPLTVICMLLGLEPERAEDFKRWTAAVIASKTGSPDAGKRPDIRSDLAEFTDFCSDLVDRRLGAPPDDPLAVLLGADDVQGPMTAKEVERVVQLLLIAGTETTTNLIGNAVIALLRNPGEIDRLRANPQWAPAVIEEALRYDSPVQALMRRATRSIELSGARIPPGAMVMALLGSANRDSSRFTDPDRFDPSRSAAGHLAFGVGPHFCLGASLARRTATMALEVLFSRARALHGPADLDVIELIDFEPLARSVAPPDPVVFTRRNSSVV